MVIACLALFMASAGTSIAAKHYLITSTKQIKPSVLAKLKGARGARGSQGPQGAQGAQGPGLTSIVTATTSVNDLPDGYYTIPTAWCPAGTYAIGTGFNSDEAGGSVSWVIRNTTSVSAYFYNLTGSAIIVQVQAICASGSGLTSSSFAVERKNDLKLIAAAKARAISANPSLKPLPSKS